MDSPQLNFLAAVLIGLVIGAVGAFTLRSRFASAIWLVPALALAGTLTASILALIFGDDRQYGWKEPILQVVLGIGGAVVAYLIGTRTAKTPAA
jgi:hypothetical protein